MECPIITCYRHKDCGILDITNKIPKDKHSCSYHREAKKEKEEIEIK